MDPQNPEFPPNRAERRAKPPRLLRSHWFDNLAKDLKAGAARRLLKEMKIPAYF